MIREIIIYPDTALKRKSEPVTQFDDALRTFFDDMEQTMLAASGAGLAAIQLGYAMRAVTVLVHHTEASGSKPSGEVLRLCNPVIVERRGSHMVREGCLSLPGYYEMVKRAVCVRVEAHDERGQRVEVAGDGKLAHALQHELEHLDGVVFVDHLSMLKRGLAVARFKKAKAKGMRYVAERPEPQDFTQRLS